MVRLAVIGAGYWGKNLVRNFHSVKSGRLLRVCDASEAALAPFRKQMPEVKFGRDYAEVLRDNEVDAVVLCTPAITHFELASQALEAGKHVYVEKPMCLAGVDADLLVEKARAAGKILMVGHLLLFHPGVTWMKQHLPDLGELRYVYTQRLNLGIVRQDENAWWSLAPHDVSIALHLLGEEPMNVAARGACYLREGIEDVVFATIMFASGKMAQIHVSWLDPHKIRKVTLVGSRKMVTFDDMEASEKIRVFDKGADKAQPYTDYGSFITLRQGDIWLPRIDMTEPLKLECEHFVSCCETGQTPLSDGLGGRAVVRVLEAGQTSLKSGGAPVALT